VTRGKHLLLNHGNAEAEPQLWIAAAHAGAPHPLDAERLVEIDQLGRGVDLLVLRAGCKREQRNDNGEAAHQPSVPVGAGSAALAAGAGSAGGASAGASAFIFNSSSPGSTAPVAAPARAAR